MTSTPKRDQVGGKHYAALEIHPDHFASVNFWDPCAFSVVKYITRHRTKNGAEDVQKAIDFVARRQLVLVEMGKLSLQPDSLTAMRMPIITACEYCRRNGIDGAERMALHHLEEWVARGDDKQRAMCVSFLQDMLASYALSVRYWVKNQHGRPMAVYKQPANAPLPDEGFLEVCEKEYAATHSLILKGVL